MKSAQVFAQEIIKYMQDHPVKTLSGAEQQIEKIVGWVQADALADKETEEKKDAVLCGIM